jgi:hypothetical protein
MNVPPVPNPANPANPASAKGLWARYSSYADIPQLNAHDLKFLAVVAQWLIAKRRARIGDALFKVIV